MILSEFYKALRRSFRNLFEKQSGRQDITGLINALEQGRSLLPLLHNKNGSPSTLFSPFHSGTVFPYNFPEFKAQNVLSPQLIEFCDCATILEELIGQCELYDEEPSHKEKESLLKLLRQFRTLLPSYKVFKSWLK